MVSNLSGWSWFGLVVYVVVSKWCPLWPGGRCRGHLSRPELPTREHPPNPRGGENRDKIGWTNRD